MERDEFTTLLNSALSENEQSERSNILNELRSGVETLFSEKETLSNENEELKEKNKGLTEANSKLFLQVSIGSSENGKTETSKNNDFDLKKML